MEQDKLNTDDIVFNTFKDQLSYNSSEYHIIMYSAKRGYEYNFHTHKIRPLNSVLWFDINNESYLSFITYLDNVFKDITQDIKYNGYVSKDNLLNCMYDDNGYIIVNIDEISDSIDTDSRSRYNCYKKWDKLHNELELFLNRLNLLYDKSEECFVYSINKNIK